MSESLTVLTAWENRSRTDPKSCAFCLGVTGNCAILSFTSLNRCFWIPSNTEDPRWPGFRLQFRLFPSWQSQVLGVKVTSLGNLLSHLIPEPE